jgi:hypothetical protein
MTALLLAAIAVGSPYVLLIGRLTNKPTPRILLETFALEDAPQQSHAQDAEPQDLAYDSPSVVLPRLTSVPKVARGPVTASVLAIYAPENLKDRRLWGLSAIATEVTKDFQYISVLPLVLGLWWFRQRLRAVPGAWVMLVLCLLQALVLWRLAILVGYVSDRHVLVLVLCGSFLAAGGLFVLGDLLERSVRRFRADRTVDSKATAERGHLALAFFLLCMLFGLQEASKPLHANRAGHRQAGLWLAEHTLPVDPVVDPFCWAHYYANRVFWEGLTPPTSPGHQLTQYVVLEKNPSSEHSRLPTIHQAKELAARGTVVYHWPEDKPQTESKIVVYAVPLSP